MLVRGLLMRRLMDGGRFQADPWRIRQPLVPFI